LRACAIVHQPGGIAIARKARANLRLHWRPVCYRPYGDAETRESAGDGFINAAVIQGTISGILPTLRGAVSTRYDMFLCAQSNGAASEALRPSTTLLQIRSYTSTRLGSGAHPPDDGAQDGETSIYFGAAGSPY